MGTSHYDWKITGNVLHIVDLNIGGKSVTNDITNVINEITETVGNKIRTLDIIYRDSEGIWDGVKPVWGVGTCVEADFYYIGEINLERAKQNIR